MPELSPEQQIEAILFVATAPLDAKQLAEAIGAGPDIVEAGLSALKTNLKGRGIQLVEHRSKYRLVSTPHAALVVRKFLQEESNSELSKAAVETLAIIAYRGPITKSGIEAVRGVSSETMLRNLHQRGLIMDAGKSSEPGRPQLYAVSMTFLQHFGLASTRDLPPLPTLEPAREN
jgi:segregation and condensation protein B